MKQLSKVAPILFGTNRISNTLCCTFHRKE